MLSREEMRLAERLASGEPDTRDEIGLLLIHQGFADRFFPGTSVLHTRVRYVLFVPWLFQHAATSIHRGSDLDAVIRRRLIQLAIRLKQGERYGVIGGDKLGELTSQPPDRVYWTALRQWGLLLPLVGSRSEAIRRLRTSVRPTLLDDDGSRLDEEVTEVFCNLPDPPHGWDNAESALDFRLRAREQAFLRRKLGLLTRPGETAPSLLAHLVASRDPYPGTAPGLPPELDARADELDQRALGIARDAADLAAIGRAVYGALVESLREEDGGPVDGTFRSRLPLHFHAYGQAAACCDLEGLETFLPNIPDYIRDVLHKTRAYVRNQRPERFLELRACYQRSEVIRKTSSRARLPNTVRSMQRRAEWDPGRHNTEPLHYRWSIVREMLNDLSSHE
jgi:Family of unknown function (DUF6361)